MLKDSPAMNSRRFQDYTDRDKMNRMPASPQSHLQDILKESPGKIESSPEVIDYDAIR